MILVIVGAMVLFWILAYAICIHCDVQYSEHDFLYVLTILGMIFSGIIFLGMLIGIGVTYITLDASIAENQQRYETLKYQLENEEYRGDFSSISRHEFYNEIQKWNTDLATGKALEDNFWIGIFYPNELYDSLDYITLPEL